MQIVNNLHHAGPNKNPYMMMHGNTKIKNNKQSISLNNTVELTVSASLGFRNKQYLLMSVTECSGHLLSCGEQCCYRTF